PSLPDQMPTSCRSLLLLSPVPPRPLPYFSFNDPPTPDIYPLSLHDALPIFLKVRCRLALLLNRSSDLLEGTLQAGTSAEPLFRSDRKSGSAGMPRPISYAVFCLKKKSSEQRTE